MLLTTHHLSLDHQKDFRPLVSDLNLTVNLGDKIALIGEEGNGKSSLLKALISPALISDYLHMTGQIVRHFHTYSYIPQSLPREIAELSLLDYFFGEDGQELDFSLLYRLADQIGFDSDRFASNQTIASLSGGERLKIQLLKAFSQSNDIIFLDEPSNDLDLDTLLWLEDLIAKCPNTLIFVSHDEDLLAKTANKIVHLTSVKKKQLAQTHVRTANYLDYRRQRELSYQKQTLQARNDQKEFDKALTKHLRQKSQVRHQLLNTHDSTQGRLLAKKMKSVLAREKRYDKQKEELTQKPLDEDSIQLFFSDIQPLPSHKILFDLVDQKLVVRDRILSEHLSLRLTAREKIGLIGPNGCGKSSLIKLLYQQVQSKKELEIGYMPQNYADLLPLKETPLAFLLKNRTRESEHQTLTLLASLQFTREEVHHSIRDLSGGQQAKLLLVKMVLDKAKLLLLDEPSRNFSPTSQPHIRRLFADYPAALVCVSHDRQFLKEVCQTIYRLTPKGLELVEKNSL